MIPCGNKHLLGVHFDLFWELFLETFTNWGVSLYLEGTILVHKLGSSPFMMKEYNESGGYSSLVDNYYLLVSCCKCGLFWLTSNFFFAEHARFAMVWVVILHRKIAVSKCDLVSEASILSDLWWCHLAKFVQITVGFHQQNGHVDLWFVAKLSVRHSYEYE